LGVTGDIELLGITPVKPERLSDLFHCEIAPVLPENHIGAYPDPINRSGSAGHSWLENGIAVQAYPSDLEFSTSR
jgi:hypothetical protein